MVGVIGGLDRDEPTEITSVEVLALASERVEEASTLSHQDRLARFALRIEHLSGAGQVVEKRLRADNVLAGAKGPDDVLGVQMIGCVDADDIDRGVGQYLPKGARRGRRSRTHDNAWRGDPSPGRTAG